MQILHEAQNAKPAGWPEGNICLNAWMQIMHPGQVANSACWPGCEFCLLAKMKKLHSGSLGAKSAFLVSANSARLVSAKNARDSYDYSLRLLLMTEREEISKER
jgi:hypothetical protein